MELKLEGKVALVSGGSRGIGAAIAEELAREGVRLFLVARDTAKLANVAQAIKDQFSTDVAAGGADLSLPESPQACVAAAVEEYGRIDILVNCVGSTKRGDFLLLSDEDWLDGFALKFHGAVRMSRAAWPYLLDSRGSIVNIVGIASRTPSAEFTIGGSVNSALLNFTKGLSDLGRPLGIRVNAINPGYIETDRLVRRLEAMAEERRMPLQQVATDYIRKLGIERFGQANEIGRLVAFLSSEAGAYFQGASLDIDGGATRGI